MPEYYYHYKGWRIHIWHSDVHESWCGKWHQDDHRRVLTGNHSHSKDICKECLRRYLASIGKKLYQKPEMLRLPFDLLPKAARQFASGVMWEYEERQQWERFTGHPLPKRRCKEEPCHTHEAKCSRR